MRRTFGGHLERLSRWGVRLGAWNDRRFHRRRAGSPVGWEAVVRLAGWLYVRPDKWGKR